MLKRFLGLVLAGSFGCLGPAAAQIAADWNTGSGSNLSGSLDGVSIDLTFGPVGPAFVLTNDFTGSDFVPPLTAATEGIAYNTGQDWAATFAQPINFLMYLETWRTADYTFDSSFTILSGLSGASVSGNTLTINPIGSNDGILLFANPVSSLNLVSANTCPNDCSGQIFTFTTIPVSPD